MWCPGSTYKAVACNLIKQRKFPNSHPKINASVEAQFAKTDQKKAFLVKSGASCLEPTSWDILWMGFTEPSLRTTNLEQEEKEKDDSPYWVWKKTPTQNQIGIFISDSLKSHFETLNSFGSLSQAYVALILFLSCSYRCLTRYNVHACLLEAKVPCRSRELPKGLG